MDVSKKEIRLSIFLIVSMFVLLCAVGILLFILGRCSAAPVESANSGYSEGPNGYGRQMGLATETIRNLDTGLRDISTDLTSIAAAAGRDASNLRELAQRLYTIAEDVKALENRVSGLRDSTREFLNQYGNSVSSEVNE